MSLLFSYEDGRDANATVIDIDSNKSIVRYKSPCTCGTTSSDFAPRPFNLVGVRAAPSLPSGLFLPLLLPLTFTLTGYSYHPYMYRQDEKVVTLPARCRSVNVERRCTIPLPSL